jgi:Holliday junction resolvasome RuvABC endonuclease subunit
MSNPLENRGKFLAIDPGILGTGWALFWEEEYIIPPEKTGVLFTKVHATKENWLARAMSIIVGLEESQLHKEISKVYIELPTFFQSAKGQVCASGKDGADSDLVKLSVLIGMIVGHFAINSVRVELIPVNKWKGQLTKTAVHARLKNRLGDKFKYTNHADDAVGIGLWVKKVFQPSR